MENTTPSNLSSDSNEAANPRLSDTPPVLPAAAASHRIRAILVTVCLTCGLGGTYLLGRLPRRREEVSLEEVSRDEKKPATVNVVHAVRSEATTNLRLPAEARAYFETTIFARTSGYVQRWLVDIGDRVKCGQLLATIDTPELDAQFHEASAKVSALEAAVRLAEAQVDFAQLTADRWDAAAPEGAVSQQERDEKKSQLANARARLDAANAQLELGKASVKGLEDQTTFKSVIAPFDGVITQRHVDVGSLITAGSTASTTPLYEIAQYDRARVFVKVPQSVTPEVCVGMDASITAREYPGRTFTGKVDRTAGAIDPVSRTLRVEVIAENPELLLLPGMYVQVDLKIVRRESPLIIQAGSLTLRAKGPQVAVIGADQCVHFKKVELARDMGDTVEITRGLRGDEWLALNISDEIGEGDRVELVPLVDAQTRTAQGAASNQENSHGREPALASY